MKYIKQSKRGQSLVEVVVACGILGIIMTAIMSITVASKNLLYQSEDQTKATALAQQGIEIVKHQKDIGCAFSTIKTKVDGGMNTFYIKGDTDGGTDPTNDENLQTTGSSNNIKNFPDFTRTISIYNLSNLSGADPIDLTDVNRSQFQPVGCGSADTSYDCIGQYYLLKVKVEKGNVSSTVKTIMSKQ